MQETSLRSALISVYHKAGLESILTRLTALGVELISTGGTADYIQNAGHQVTRVEDLTAYPSILGGRVKTLHPKVFGGILGRRSDQSDQGEMAQYELPPVDLVIVDLYPFEQTLQEGASEAAIIEKIDIGGIALIRAAAKNYQDVLVIPSQAYYGELEELLSEGQGRTTLHQRQRMAAAAFGVSSHYDAAIFNHFNREAQLPELRISEPSGQTLRYGENPHQKGVFYGQLENLFEQLNGKALSYNNLVDLEAAVGLAQEFEQEKQQGLAAAVIVKHTNACGVALAPTMKAAYLNALAADPVSAFGGVIVLTQPLDQATAEELHKLFFEILIAPDFENSALELLKEKKNRIILRQKPWEASKGQFKSLLGGVLWQETDRQTETAADLQAVTTAQPSPEQQEALLFAAKVAKHSKSNTIVLAKYGQLLASGVGQTSRVDALKQAIAKAKNFGFDLQGAVMASDAFFPFPDCVEIGQEEGLAAIVQPGGSVRDQLSIDAANQAGMAMAFTGYRHFKH